MICESRLIHEVEVWGDKGDGKSLMEFRKQPVRVQRIRRRTADGPAEWELGRESMRGNILHQHSAVLVQGCVHGKR
jgi:hypothetical protein